jgi:hypothetical protein
MDTKNEQAKIEPVGEFLSRRKSLFNDFPVPHSVVEDSKFIAYKPSIKVFYFYLAHLVNRYSTDEGWAFRSLRILAKDTGLDIKTIRAARNQLMKDGFIEYHDGQYHPEYKTRQAGIYRVWGGQIAPVKEVPINNQSPSEDQQNYQNDDVGIYGSQN